MMLHVALLDAARADETQHLIESRDKASDHGCLFATGEQRADCQLGVRIKAKFIQDGVSGVTHIVGDIGARVWIVLCQAAQESHQAGTAISIWRHCVA